MASVVASKASKWFSLKRSKLRLFVPHLPSSPVAVPCSPSSSRDRTSELWEVFKHFDRDRDGRVSYAELRASFDLLGEEMPAAAAQAVIADLDSDGDQLLDFEDFVRLVEGEGEKIEIKDDEELKKVFEMFEVVKGSGRITPRGLKTMLSRLGDERSIKECKTMIGAYDLDGDGELNFHEFYQMMT
ncbi:putative calcium-binding protein CML19 [Zingiber officinale]|uniref:putative calcium-binding protein CML19 n=1 Tax=Zingiber officinale TaxID=94328 RepID=UPI001C4D4373|nr:putative calcium-binding protein CML19 [Zingiber officinale]